MRWIRQEIALSFPAPGGAWSWRSCWQQLRLCLWVLTFHGGFLGGVLAWHAIVDGNWLAARLALPLLGLAAVTSLILGRRIGVKSMLDRADRADRADDG